MKKRTIFSAILVLVSFLLVSSSYAGGCLGGRCGPLKRIAVRRHQRGKSALFPRFRAKALRDCGSGGGGRRVSRGRGRAQPSRVYAGQASPTPVQRPDGLTPAKPTVPVVPKPATGGEKPKVIKKTPTPAKSVDSTAEAAAEKAAKKVLPGAKEAVDKPAAKLPVVSKPDDILPSLDATPPADASLPKPKVEVNVAGFQAEINSLKDALEELSALSLERKNKIDELAKKLKIKPSISLGYRGTDKATENLANLLDTTGYMASNDVDIGNARYQIRLRDEVNIFNYDNVALYLAKDGKWIEILDGRAAVENRLTELWKMAKVSETGKIKVRTGWRNVHRSGGDPFVGQDFRELSLVEIKDWMKDPRGKKYHSE